MNDKAQLYCDACNAITSGQYLKDWTCKLMKYKKALTNPIPSGMDQSPVSYQILARLTDNLNTEIERKKIALRSVVNKILIGVTIMVIGSIILYFFLPSKVYIIQPQPPPQLEEHKNKLPSAENQVKNKPRQLKQQ